MKRKTVRVFAALAVAAVMLSGTVNVHAEESYTTKSGDSLQKIAKEIYGDAEKWNVIYEANRDQIKNPNKIWSNQTLTLPDTESVTVQNSEQTAEETNNESTEAPDVATDASALLQNVYNLMAAQDYNAMHAVDGSDEAQTFVNAMAGDRAVYIPDGSLTGTGAGIYKFGSNGYYFYYGEYVNGVRSGNGTHFVSGADYMEIFSGTWDNDAPNGQGSITRISDESVYVHSGNLVNGLWDGTGNIVITYPEGDSYNLAFTAENGVAEDKTEEYRSHFKYLMEEGDEYYYDLLPDEDRFIYAYTGESNGMVVDGVEQYYPGTDVYFYYRFGKTLGVYGWED